MPSDEDADGQGGQPGPAPAFSLDKPAVAPQPASDDPWAVRTPPPGGEQLGAVPADSIPAGYPAPGGYPVAPGYPQPAGYPYWQAPPGPPTGYNGYAITSLVTGLLGIACFLWVAAIAFGIAALRQIPQRNQKGRGMAIAGIVAGVVWPVVGVVLTAGLLIAHPGTGSHRFDPLGPAGGPAGSVSVFELRPGDCFDRLDHDPTSVTQVTTQPCSLAHDGEVFGSAAIGSVGYPGKAELIKQADKGCADLVDSYAMDREALPDSVDLHFFYPDETSWKQLDVHTATCIFVSGDARLTGSLRRDGSTLTGEQLAYLQALHHVEIALDKQPDGRVSDHPQAYRAWAELVADGLAEEIRQLSEASWSHGSADPVAGLLADLRQSLPHWQSAYRSTDNATLIAEIGEAIDHPDDALTKAVRAGLGLPPAVTTHTVRPADPSGSPSSEAKPV
ncbi:DUF4190 domain-containing protein [Kitasatospora sp. McL0602]|uniref:DUF4190 domain-containing protein n=1 Tax=Kitasatospora sp. McL0602 TaxID=3439530 RepID=UPI003F8A83BB